MIAYIEDIARYAGQTVTINPANFTNTGTLNAGPGNIARMRADAARRGLDPDQWFDHVEIVVARRIGSETTTYVRNIYKYYVAYKLAMDAHDAAQKAREQVAPRPGA